MQPPAIHSNSSSSSPQVQGDNKTNGTNEKENRFTSALFTALNLVGQPFCALCFLLKKPWHHEQGRACATNSSICRTCYTHSIIERTGCGLTKPQWMFPKSINICYRCVTPRAPCHGFVFCQEHQRNDTANAKVCAFHDIIKDLIVALLNYNFGPSAHAVNELKKAFLHFIGLDSQATVTTTLTRVCMSHPLLPSFPVATVAAYFIIANTFPMSVSFQVSDYSIIQGNQLVVVPSTGDSKNNTVSTCYICGAAGHFAKECKNRTSCYKCGLTGHWAAACPSKKEGNSK
jgi:hypothetical protein